ncbi:MAG: helix-turn-helix domain-containing protein [Caulobacteraceae bacterium]
MKRTDYAVDAYVFDTLMRDLVGHDRRPSAFLVYLALVAAAAEKPAALSYAQLAERTGLSKRGAQDAVRWLQARALLRTTAPRSVTETPVYEPLRPWKT